MFFHLKLHFVHTRRGLQICWWCDVIAGNSAPVSPIQNLFSQNQHKIASTGKHIVMIGRPKVLSVSAKFQVQTLCCLPEISKCIRAEL